jgi:hypothetical protein
LRLHSVRSSPTMSLPRLRRNAAKRVSAAPAFQIEISVAALAHNPREVLERRRSRRGTARPPSRRSASWCVLPRCARREFAPDARASGPLSASRRQ